MRQNIHARLFIMGLIVLVYFALNCGKPGEPSGNEIAAQLLKYLNKQLPGSKFKADLEKSIVEAAGNNYYWVTFKNSAFTTDLAWMVKIIQEEFSLNDSPEDFFIEEDTGRMEEIVILYGPRKKYVSLRSIKNLSVAQDFSKLVAAEKLPMTGDFSMKKILVSIGDITYKDLDISDLLKSAKGDFLPGIANFIKRILDPFDFNMRHLKFEVNGTTSKKEYVSVFLDIEKISGVKEGIADPYISIYTFKKDAPVPNLSNTLQRGLSLVDLDIRLGKANILIKRNGKQWGGGTIGSASYSLFIKPDETQTFFNIGFSCGQKNLKLSIPVEKEMELLSDIKDFQFNFSVEHLSPEVVLALIDFIKYVIELRDVADNSKMQEISLQVIKFWAVLGKSKPLVKFSISPFKHYFGELELKAEMRLSGLFSWPDAKLTVVLLKIDDIIKKLEEVHMFSPSTLKAIVEIVETYTVRKENGDVAITWELRSDQPGKYFFNGKPMIINPMMILR